MSNSCVNFINILCSRFLYKILAPKITKLCFGFVTREKLLNLLSYKKFVSKMLMKLTTGCCTVACFPFSNMFVSHNQFERQFMAYLFFNQLHSALAIILLFTNYFSFFFLRKKVFCVFFLPKKT